MADLSTITTGGVTYNICDDVARTAITNDCITISATLSSLPRTISNVAITSDMVVVNATFGTPANIVSNISWATSNGQITLSGTLSGSTTCVLVLAKSESV